MDFDRAGMNESTIEDDGSLELNDELDKNVDAEEDFEFCYNCHSWEHNTKNCTVIICEKGEIDNVPVGCGKQGHTRLQCTKNPIPTPTASSNMPNSNTSKKRIINDKARPKIFPISIKLLCDKKNAKKDQSDENLLEDNKLNEAPNFINSFNEISSVDQSQFTSGTGAELRTEAAGFSSARVSSSEISITPPLNILTPPEENPTQERSASPISVASSQSSTNQRSYSPKWRKSHDPSSVKNNKSFSKKQQNSYTIVDTIDLCSTSSSHCPKTRTRPSSSYSRDKRYSSPERSRSSSGSKYPKSVSPDSERSWKRPTKLTVSSKSCMNNLSPHSKSPNGYGSYSRSTSPQYSKHKSRSPDGSSPRGKYSDSPKRSSRSPPPTKSNYNRKKVSQTSNSSTDSQSRSLSSSSSKLQKSIQKELEKDSNAKRGDWDPMGPVVTPIHRSPGGSRYKSPSPLRKPEFRSSLEVRSSPSLSPSPPPSLREKRRDSPAAQSEKSLHKDCEKQGTSWSPSSESDTQNRYSRYPLSPPSKFGDHRKRSPLPKNQNVFPLDTSRTFSLKHSNSNRNSRDSEKRSRCSSSNKSNSRSYSRSPSRKRSRSPVLRQESHEEFLERLVSIGQGKPTFSLTPTEHLNPNIDTNHFLSALQNPITGQFPSNISGIEMPTNQQLVRPVISPSMGLPMGLTLNQPPPSNAYSTSIQPVLPQPSKSSMEPSMNLLLTSVPFMGPPLMYGALPPNNMSQNIPSNKNIKSVSENKLLLVRQNDLQSNPGNIFKMETNLNNEKGEDEDDVRLISSWVKIEGLPNTLRREDVINQLALLGFMIGKAYTTNGITLLAANGANETEVVTTVQVQFKTKAIAICFMKRTKERFFSSKERNISYVSSQMLKTSLDPYYDYAFPDSKGEIIHGLVCCIGIKVGIYPVNEYHYQIRPEIISCTVRDESFVMKFETQNFVQKNQKENEFRKFMEEFETLVMNKLKQKSPSSGFDKALFVFENAKNAKMFWLWLQQCQDFDVISNVVECYGFGDRLSSGDMKKDINNVLQQDCNEIDLSNPTHKSCILDDLLHYNVSKNQSYLARAVLKDFKYNRELKLSLQRIWLTNSSEIVVVFIAFKYILVNHQPYLTEIQLCSPRTDKSAEFIYVRPATANGKVLENIIGYKMEEKTGQWVHHSKETGSTSNVVSEKEALKLMIEYLRNQKAGTNRSVVLFTSSCYVNVPLLLLAFERHFDLLGDFLSTICGVSDLMSLTKEYSSEIYDIGDHNHIISPSLHVLYPLESPGSKRIQDVEHLYEATESICRDRTMLDSFLLERSVSFEHLHLFEVQGASDEIIPQSTISIKSKSFKKMDFTLKEMINVGQPLVCLTKRYEELGLEIVGVKLLGSQIELTIQNNSRVTVSISKNKPIGHIIPNPYNVKWPSNLRWLPTCLDTDFAQPLNSNSDSSNTIHVFHSTASITISQIFKDESNMILPLSTSLFVLGRQKERKLVTTKQTISDLDMIENKIQVYFVSIKIQTIKGEQHTVKEICLVNDKGETAFYSHSSEHIMIVKEFHDFLLNHAFSRNVVLIGFKIHFLFKTLEALMRQTDMDYYKLLNNCVKYLCDLEWCLKGEYVSSIEKGLIQIASEVQKKDLKHPPSDTFSVSSLVYDLVNLQVTTPLTSLEFLQRCCLERSYVERLYRSNNGGIHACLNNPLILIEIESIYSAQIEEANQFITPTLDLHINELNEKAYHSDMSIDFEDNFIDQAQKDLIDKVIEDEVKNYVAKDRKSSIEKVDCEKINMDDIIPNQSEEKDQVWSNSSKQKDPRLRKTMEKKKEHALPATPEVKPPINEIEMSETALPSWSKQKTVNVERDKDEIAIIYVTFLKSGQKQYLTSLHVYLPNLGGQVFKVDSITPTANWPDSEIGKYYKKNPHGQVWNRWILKECIVREPVQKTEGETIESLKSFLGALEESHPSMRLNIAVLVPSHVHYLENVLGRYDMKFETHFRSVAKWCDLTTFVYNNFTDNSMHWKAPDENLRKLEELYFHVFNRHPDPRQMFKPKLMYDIFWKLTCEEINFPPFYQNNTHIFRLDETKKYLYINIHLGIELINGEEAISTIGLYNALNKQGNISEFPQKILLPLLPKPRHEDKWERLPGFQKLSRGKWGYKDGDKTVKCKSEKDALATISKIMGNDCVNGKYDGFILIFLDHKGFPHFLNATVLHGLESKLLEKLAGVGDVATITQCLDDDCPMSSNGRLPSLKELETNYQSLLKTRGEETMFIPFSEANAQVLARAACMLFFSMKNQKCNTDKKSQISLHHIASPLRSPYVNMLLYKSEIPIFREAFGSVLINNELRVSPTSPNSLTTSQPISVKCILTGIIFGNEEMDFVIDRDPESLVEVLEEKKPKLGKNSVFEVSVVFNVRREMLLPAGTKIGVAKTGSLAMLTHVPQKNKSIIPSTTLTTPEFSTIDLEGHGEGDAESDSEIRDALLENKQTSKLSSPRAEKDLSVNLEHGIYMEQVVKQNLGEPTKIPSRQSNIAESIKPLSKNEHTFEPELSQKDDAEFCDSSTTNQNQEMNDLGRILVEQTDFLTKSCYPNLKPLYEMYCIHCVNTDQRLSDKDVIDVADDIMPSLASFGIDDMSELEKVVVDEAGKERKKEVAHATLLDKYVGLDNLLEENILNLLVELIYGYHRRNKNESNKHKETRRLSTEKTSKVIENNQENVQLAKIPKTVIKKSGPATDPRQNQNKFRRPSITNQSLSLKDILNLDGSTKQVSIGKIIDLDSAYCSVKIPLKGLYEVSRQSVIYETSKELTVQSHVLARMHTNEDKCSKIVEVKYWKKMSDCHFGFVEEHVGKNMVTVAFIDEADTISIALVSKISALFVNDSNATKESFSVGTRVAICVEKNQAEEIKKQRKETEYKGLLLFKQTVMEPGPETFQMIIHGGQFSQEKLSQLKEFFPLDVNFRSDILHNPSQNKVLLITAHDQQMLVVSSTILKAENHIIKEVPGELRTNIDMMNQVFGTIVKTHPGVCIRLNTEEDKIIIACKASVSVSVETCFEKEVKKYRDTQSTIQTGYSSSDSMQYEPAQDDDEILSKKVGAVDRTKNNHTSLSNGNFVDSQCSNGFTSEKESPLLHRKDRTEIGNNYIEPKPINIASENVAKMLAVKIEERNKRMESEERDLRALRKRDHTPTDFNQHDKDVVNKDAYAGKSKKPALTAFERYFGRFKAMPKRGEDGTKEKEKYSQDSEKPDSSLKPEPVSTNNNEYIQTGLRSKSGSQGDVNSFLKTMRGENDLSRLINKDHLSVKRPPSPPALRERSRSPLQHNVYRNSASTYTNTPFQDSNQFDKNESELKRKCDHFPFPDKICKDFFELGQCSFGKVCKNAHNIQDPIKIDYCFKYIDQTRRKECSGTYDTKCGKAHIGFWKLQKKYKTELRQIRQNCKLCGDDASNIDGQLSDVSSAEEGKDKSSNRSVSRDRSPVNRFALKNQLMRENASNISPSTERSPNRFAVKNEIMKGCLSSKSTKCAKCPISDELCVIFVGQKCQFFPKCFKAHKIPNRMNIKYCSDFVNKDTFCKGNCGDPHIKFERLRSVYKEETQIMYKSCSICSNDKSSKRSLSPEAPSECSTHSSTNHISRTRSPLPSLPNRRMVAYESEDDGTHDKESSFNESGSQRSASPGSLSSKDGNRGNGRIITRNQMNTQCKYYQAGKCIKGNTCIFSHFASRNNRR